VPDVLTIVFFFLKTDLIRACYAGALPSFAECKQLTNFKCYENQFTGAYSRVSTDRSVVPDIPAVVFCLLKTDWIRACYAGALPSFATCVALTKFFCGHNQLSGA
jgi:hypothetical protein